MTGARLSNPDLELLDTLALRCRTMSVDQVAEHWWPGERPNRRRVRRRLSRLALKGWVRCWRAPARKLAELSAPLACWRPEFEQPDLGEVARITRSRWRHPVQSIELVGATRRACRHFGAVAARKPRPSETSHDLGLTAVFLTLVRRDRAHREQWWSEERLRKLGYGDQIRLPDAMLRSKAGDVVIEFAGAYCRAKLEAFHAFCVSRQLAYELW
jgi:hypothetical protein